MEQLLITKLYIPSTRPELVPRPRLIERLNQGLHRRLTLISAPAGFGKTTLVSEWVEQLRLDASSENQNEYKIAWLSLDEGDNDSARFLTYFITALQMIDSSIGQKAQTSALVDRCRKEGVTVNSALTAAIVGAQTSLQGEKAFHSSIGVVGSLRDRLQIPVGEVMGFFAGADSSHRIFQDIKRYLTSANEMTWFFQFLKETRLTL